MCQEPEVTILDFTSDDDLIRATMQDGSSRHRIYQPDRVSVVLGRSSQLSAEVHLDRCVMDRVPLYRRRGGGCAVVLDQGNLIVSTVFSVPGLPSIRSLFQRLSAWMIAQLNTLGITNIHHREISDLTVGGTHKIGGACLYITRNVVYYATTLLIEPRLELMEQYLYYPPREPDYRKGRPHNEFVTTLNEHFPQWNTPALLAALQESMAPFDL